MLGWHVRNNPDAALQGGGMTRAEREALMAKLEQSQRSLAEANKQVEEANKKLAFYLRVVFKMLVFILL